MSTQAHSFTLACCRLWLNTKDVERTVTMDVVPEGKGQVRELRHILLTVTDSSEPLRTLCSAQRSGSCGG